MIDIHILPKKAQNELIDFYQFLVERYRTGQTKNKMKPNKDLNNITAFFDGYNIDLSDFKLNRDEIYDR
jgi:hypothetical protein